MSEDGNKLAESIEKLMEVHTTLYAVRGKDYAGMISCLAQIMAGVKVLGDSTSSKGVEMILNSMEQAAMEMMYTWVKATGHSLEDVKNDTAHLAARLIQI